MTTDWHGKRLWLIAKFIVIHPHLTSPFKGEEFIDKRPQCDSVNFSGDLSKKELR